jgi:hypothetical protein
MRVTCLLAIVATAGSAAVAQQAPPAPAEPPIVVTGEKPPPPAEKMVCKLTDTGTMLKKRICLPKSEWSIIESNSEETLKQLRDWQRVRCNYGTRC